ncbi:MAG: CARDB domain-containing protein [Solirubrobacterales bacterium]
MAFLDEEQEQSQRQPPPFPEEPEAPRRRFGGAERRRQQFLIRRLIAVGVGIGFLILLVLGVRGCLEARSDRALRNYAQDVSTIMQESEQRGSEFFDLVDSPGGATEQEFEQSISSLRGASQSLLDRAENIGTPDQMREAQSAVTLSLKLRRDALQVMAENVGRATADRETADATEAITAQMGSLYASDILWGQVGSPEITAVLEDEGVEAPSLPAGNFMPEGPEATEYLDQTTIVEKLSGVTGGEEVSGTRGLGLEQVDVGDVTLSPDATTEVPDDAREVEVSVQNQGEADEGGIRVVVTLNGEELAKTIEELAPGESGSVALPISTLPQPGTEVQVEVLVEPVPGEQVTDNNQASYTVIFGSATE